MKTTYTKSSWDPARICNGCEATLMFLNDLGAFLISTLSTCIQALGDTGEGVGESIGEERLPLNPLGFGGLRLQEFKLERLLLRFM